MADDKKYYYMRLKENFFDSNEIVLLESMPDGYLYSNILLKLYLRSLKDDGRLMFNERIPYNAQMIATITRHQVGTVEKALKIFIDMGLIEILDSGAIYMLDIQNYIGKSSTEADRRRAYDRRIKEEKLLLESKDVRNLKEISEKSTPEIEIEKEIEIKIENNSAKAPRPTKHKYGEYKHVLLTDEEHQKLVIKYGGKMTDECIKYLDEYIEMKGYKAKSHYLCILKWVYDAVQEHKPKQERRAF